jgi:hypothetical protein
MGMRLASALALVLGVITFAGPAFAANGNGTANTVGNGNNGKANNSSAPGNSADASGQLKKDDGASSPPSTTTATSTTAAASSAPTSGPGVKPANDTAHETHAAASSTKTKLYGNGKTAGEIAIHNGASPSTVLHGPGNSQPHKAAPCSGGHEVDVHALKSKRHGKSCGSDSKPTPTGSDTGGKDDKGSDPGTSPETVTTPTGTPAAPSSPVVQLAKPEVSTKVTRRQSGSVLATVQRPAGPTLPFTGFPLWAGVALGLVLLGLGLGLSLLAGRETEREVRP